MTTKKLMTALEFLHSGPQTDGFELVRGELVRMPRPDRKHGIVCGNGGYLLKAYSKQIGHGVVLSNDAGIVTAKNPDSVRAVDVAIFLHPPAQGLPEGYTDQPPDVAVEVRSPGQAWAALVAKVSEYLAMGVRMVWIIDPRTRRLTVFTAEDEPQTFAAENELDGGTILPGFRCRVADFFEGV
jgi:Uma2 family endonuclease